jgi:hypothetical protein
MSQVFEILTGTVGGGNVTFTSSQIPQFGSLHIFNIVAGVSTELTGFTFSETTITLAVAPTTGDIFAAYNVKPNEETALDLLADALIEISVATIEDRENINIADLNLALRHFNRMLASANVDRTSIFTIRKDEVTLIANQESFTIGVDPAGILVADLNIARPSRIKNIIIQSSSIPSAVRMPALIEMDHDSFMRRASMTTYGIPIRYYYDGAYPFGRIYFDPGPAAAYVAEIWSWQQAAKVANIYDPISVPPEYYDYWLYQLAVRLCAPFGKSVSPALSEMERRAVQKVTGNNCKAPLLECEAAMLNGGGVPYDWNSGEVR